MTEHVLNYDHSVVPQEYGWDCGPASTQVVLNGRGVIQSEDALIPTEGTTVNGTNDISCVAPALNQFLPGANYQFSYINEPPSQADRDQLWAHITQSIDAGYGLVLNFVAPPSNYPVGVKGSQSPSYGGGTVYHYVSCMGYDDDPVLRAVWIADPGFRPFGYWISLDQCASLIAPKGYTYSTAAPVVPAPAPSPAPEPAPAEPQDTLWADVSEFQNYVDDSYPYGWISIRSNDGTYQDHKFAQNYAWCVNAVNSGKLKGFIVYFYWHPNWQDCVNTHRSMIEAAGGPHPQMVSMIDVERGGNPAGDFSDALNATDDSLSAWLGDPKRVIAYANTGDFNGMWSNRREDQLIVAAYGSNPDFPGKFAHQYTDGKGYGGGLPEGCPPFGNCDMNSADGYSPDALAAALGVTATTTPGGPFMAALSDAEQHEVLDGIRWLKDQFGPNLWGPASSMGKDAQGDELTVRDGLAELKREVEASATSHIAKERNTDMALQLPGATEIAKIHEELDKGIDALTTVLDFVEKYGKFIPGVGDKLAIVEEIDTALKTAKAFLDKVPV